MKQLTIDTTGTRYTMKEGGDGLWFLKGWRDFLKSAGLTTFDQFVHLSGTEVDRNKRSLVYRLKLGEDKQVFYLKLHTNYVRRNLSTLYKKVLITQIELTNMMHYARAGLDELEPVACGWRSGEDGISSFLLIKELDGYQSLQDFLTGSDCSSRQQRRAVAEAVVAMLAKMHGYGLAHIELFSWHIFVKKTKDGHYLAQPIDLERTINKDNWPWSQWLIRRKHANDLAVLNLTVPWPHISSAERMRFYHAYCKTMGISKNDRSFFKLILGIAKHRGRRSKFQPAGVFARMSVKQV
ncbi:MAG: lipopolysaccharide kinase InaA family protein [Thermodesulfobacteriota bacterium]|nr:lipopolysaccharide kinase InaA family protein [Thermodesulfobacteriota bacterium]